jgi:uncharacterized protein involved in response to NO
MSPLTITTRQERRLKVALFNLGFRPFFLGAIIFAILSMSLWMAIYIFRSEISIRTISAFQWHAHEMIYGYSLAVIAGFLLTAIKNWTGIQTAHGIPLMVLFSFWCMARILFLFGTEFIYFAGIFDLLFILFLILTIASPIIQTRNWKQLGIVTKVMLLGTGNLFFYLGILGYVENGVYWSIYGGLYLVIALILTMGRRVIPSFIERGVDYQVRLFNSKWIDISNLLFFSAFFIFELFLTHQSISAYIAAGLFIINLARLIGWHTMGIWKKPLLWSLYLSLVFIDVGFLLFTLSAIFGLSPFLAIHAFAVGGIGFMTMGMMARVSLGHTGRNIHNPPRLVILSLIALLLSVLSRVGLPLLDMNFYSIWIGISQVLWILAFLSFMVAYAPILIRSRMDGQFG